MHYGWYVTRIRTHATFRLGHVYNGSYLDLSADASSNFCNKLFSAWDFNVADPETVKLKKACIATDLKVLEITTFYSFL